MNLLSALLTGTLVGHTHGVLAHTLVGLAGAAMMLRLMRLAGRIARIGLTAALLAVTALVFGHLGGSFSITDPAHVGSAFHQ